MTAVAMVPCPRGCAGGMAYGDVECPRCVGFGSIEVAARPIPEPVPTPAAVDRVADRVRISLSSISHRAAYAAPLIARSLLVHRAPGQDPAQLVVDLAIVDDEAARRAVLAACDGLEEHARVLRLTGYGRDPVLARAEARRLEALAEELRS